MKYVLISLALFGLLWVGASNLFSDRIERMIIASDPNAVVVSETAVISNFNEEVEWQIEFSQFRTVNIEEEDDFQANRNNFYRFFDLLSIFDASNVPLEVTYFVEAPEEKKLLGTRIQYDNQIQPQWIAVKPTSIRLADDDKDEPRLLNQYMRDDSERSKQDPPYIQMHGYLASISLWVWNTGQKTEYVFYVEDHFGVVHEIPAGENRLYGWQKISVDIPPSISQYQYFYPFIKPLKVIGFKLYPKMRQTDDEYIAYFGTLICNRYIKRSPAIREGGDRARSIWLEDGEENTETEEPSGGDTE
jgi:hypothetical protein